MRYLVLSDIHANLEALDACLADARRRGYDRTLLLGDVVGYGGDPNAVIDCVQALEPVALVRGNHDKVACGLEMHDGFNAVAKRAVGWTLDVLTPEHREWLAALPQGPHLVDDLVEICHGSPLDEDAYIFDEIDALRALKGSAREVCLFGHTHHPLVFAQSSDRLDSASPSAAETTITFEPGWRYLVNPGAVGQPRDGDPRAAYGILDRDRRSIGLYRVTYPVNAAQAKVVKAGLPDVLAKRLATGR